MAVIALLPLANRITVPAAAKGAGPMVVREAVRGVLLERRS